MPTTEEVVRAHQERQQNLVQRTLAAVLRMLGLMSRERPGASWTGGVDERVLAAVIAAQQESAEAGADYIRQVLRAAGVRSRMAGRVSSRALAGTASDGRSLNSLLGVPIATAIRNIERGMSPDEAFERMIRRMAMIVATQVDDAGRVAAGVAQAGDRVILGYERMVNAGACSRCIILAGQVYAWSDGFERHPNCACVHRPIYTIEDYRDRAARRTAKQIFDGMSRAEQDRTFGAAAAQAIRDGADIGQVVNARRGLSVAGGRRTTTEGTTRRGSARRRGSPSPRIMPEEIYRLANGDRAEAIRLLRLYGYIV
ncbi:hypothetical protein [Actinomadura sp. 21ATH]|uniref:hypothetical protein n=1 Tax=Actinomadura sp. 21ATH TaxID=1735444 RepID=UPI0035C20186